MTNFVNRVNSKRKSELPIQMDDRVLEKGETDQLMWSLCTPK